MARKMLKIIRFFVPATLLYFALVAICWFSHWCELAMPTQYDQLTKSIFAIVLGFLYSVSGLRARANRDYHSAVNKNLMCKLTRPFADDPDIAKRLPWSTIRPIFYGFVDNDASLKHQSGLAYWNGAFWTSAADLRAISFLACIATALMMLFANAFDDPHFDTVRAIYFFLLSVFTFLISILLSRLPSAN